MDRVKDKVALVTGGASGIGKSISIMFASEGAKVAVADINDDDGNNVVSKIKTQKGIAKYFHMDVTVESKVKDTCNRVYEAFGKINILVNNAGILGVNALTHTTDEEDWDRVIAVNLKGAFFCVKHVIPQMLQAKEGSIINIGSVYGVAGEDDYPAYHASKGALRAMTKTDAIMYARENIRVNIINPGAILTSMVEESAKAYPGGLNELLIEYSGYHPVGHIGVPEDVAYAALYLASDESRFVTGAEIAVDGGYLAR